MENNLNGGCEMCGGSLRGGYGASGYPFSSDISGGFIPNAEELAFTFMRGGKKRKSKSKSRRKSKSKSRRKSKSKSRRKSKSKSRRKSKSKSRKMKRK